MHDAPLRHSRVIDRSPVPYAWVVLAAALVTTMMTVPGQTIGVSVFLDPILVDLGATRSTVSLLYTIGTLIGSFVLPFVGRFVDRRGPRLGVAVVAGAFALACLYMSSVASLAMLAVGFVLIRGLGQGSLSLVGLHVVNLWFVRRRGLAIGLLGLGMSIATAFFPPLLERLIATLGWRASYAAMAAAVALIAVPLGVTFFRGRPEEYGERPDGHRPRTPTDADAVDEMDLSLGQARRTAAFWFVTVGDVAVAALGTGLVFHHFDILGVSGVDRATAAAVFVPLGLVTAGANVGTGALLDRMPPRFALAAMLAFLSGALVLAGWVSPLWLPVYGVLVGLAQGMKGAISGSAYAYYFGRRHIGSIKGFATTISVAGTAIGPLVFAVGRDVSGSYLPVLLLSALVPAVLAVASLALRPPRRVDAAS
ncbi:MAG: MFS transporter [Trueperaceae bacterium]|nr:MFS transporter [Trueperaceae bacterium]